MSLTVNPASRGTTASSGVSLASELKQEVKDFLATKHQPLDAGEVSKVQELIAAQDPQVVFMPPPKGNLGASTTKAYVVTENGKRIVYANVRNTDATGNNLWYRVGEAPAAAPERVTTALTVQHALSSPDGKQATLAAVKQQVLDTLANAKPGQKQAAIDDVEHWLGPKGSGDSYIDKKYGQGVITLLNDPIKVDGSGTKFKIEVEVNDNELWGGAYNEHLYLIVDLSGPKPQISSYKQPEIYKTTN
jgi:hypothetical protein